MIKTESFPALFLSVYAPIAVVAITLLYFLGGAAYFEAAIWGAALSVILVWITILSISSMIYSSFVKFQALVMGGILFRFFIVLFSSIAVHFFTDLHLESFIAGLFISYILMQILEITYIQSRFRNMSNKDDESEHDR